MKKNITSIAILILISLASFGQKVTYYKTDHWGDIKGKGDFVTAMDNPTYEKVVIAVTTDSIKVILGKKRYDYKIISVNRFSSMDTDYTVELNGKQDVLSITIMIDYTVAIGIEKKWMVADITDISTPAK